MTETMYEKLGISKEVYEFGQTIEAGLKELFSQMDEVADVRHRINKVVLLRIPAQVRYLLLVGGDATPAPFDPLLVQT